MTLDNAIRYTPPGGKVLAELEARVDGVRIRISDTGIGIGADAAAHVFELLPRGQGAIERKRRIRAGTGDREMDRRIAPRRGGTGQPAGRGEYVYGDFAAVRELGLMLFI